MPTCLDAAGRYHGALRLPTTGHHPFDVPAPKQISLFSIVREFLGVVYCDGVMVLRVGNAVDDGFHRRCTLACTRLQ
jgi:hypothetical protein